MADMGIYPAESFGRIHHLPTARLAEVMDGLRDRDLLDGSGRFTDAGRATKARIESLTDVLAEAPYHGLATHQLDQLITVLEPISKRLEATGSRTPTLPGDRWQALPAQPRRVGHR
jgi:Helix-turn-helix family